MTGQDQIKNIEVSIEQLNVKIKAGEDLDKLHRQAAFKSLFTVGYFQTKAQEAVAMKALPQTDIQKELLNNVMIGISALQSHFRAIYVDADNAKQALAEYRAEHAAAIQEAN